MNVVTLLVGALLGNSILANALFGSGLLNKSPPTRPRNGVGRVVGFKLVQSKTGVVLVENVTNGTIFYHNEENTPAFSIVAITSASLLPLHGVQFNFDGRTNFRTDRIAPYALCRNKRQGCPSLGKGSHSVTGMVLNNPIPFTVQFQVMRGPAPFTPPSTPTAPSTSPPNRQAPNPVAATAPGAPVPRVTPTLPVVVPTVPAPVVSPFTPAAVPAKKATTAPKALVAPVVAPKKGVKPPTKAPTRAINPPAKAPQRAVMPPTKSPVVVQTKAPVKKPTAPTKKPTAPRVVPTRPAPKAVPLAPVLITVPQASVPSSGAPVVQGPVVPVVPVVVPVTTVAPTAVPATTAAPVEMVPVATDTPVANLTLAPVATAMPTANTTVAPVAPVATAMPVVNTTVAPVAPVATAMPVVNMTVAPVAPIATVMPVVNMTVAPVGVVATNAPMAPVMISASIRINCGGDDYLDRLGRPWMADRYFTGGAVSKVNKNISFTDDDSIFSSERFGKTTYNVPVPNGNYTVILNFAELYYMRVNKRIFDVSVEGQSLLDIDLVQLGNGANLKAITRVISPVTVNDGFLTLRMMDNVPKVDNPKISGIEIIPLLATAAPIVVAPAAAPLTMIPVDNRTIAPLAPGSVTLTPVTMTLAPATAPIMAPMAALAPAVSPAAPLISLAPALAPTSPIATQAPVVAPAVAPVAAAPASKVTLAPATAPKALSAPPSLAPIVAVTLAPAAAPTASPLKTAVPTVAPLKIPVPTVAPVQPTFQPILINCGGAEFTDVKQRVWMADKYFNGGNLFGTGDDILGVVGDDELYKSHRWGQLSYKIPVPLGSYEVVLHSAEIYFREVGKRVFDVDIEGTLIEDIDLVKLGGAGFTAVQIPTTVYVLDGFLSIKLLDNVPLADYPTLGAIEVNRVGEVPPAMAPAPVTPKPFQTILILCGGTEYTDAQGRLWSADKYFDGGNAFFENKKEISGTSDDTIYHGERWGTFSYEIPIPEGNYAVTLHFAEIYFDKRGDRVFDFEVEKKQFFDFDIVAFGGRPNKVVTREMPVVIDDGFLSLKFMKNDPQFSEPKLSAIEVRQISPHYSHAVTGGPYNVVDVDGNGSELVKVTGKESHTHGPGQTLSTFTWRLGKVILGTGEVAILTLPVGRHDVSLTVVDTSGDVNIDVTVITVKPDGFPQISSLTPVSGGVEGGMIVTITGTALRTATEVKFGRVNMLANEFTIVDDKTITLLAPLSALGVPVQVSVMTPFGASNSMTFTYIDSAPIAFNVQTLLNFGNPCSVAFGPDGKLYVGNTRGQLGRFTLNESYDTVVESVVTTIDKARGIHGIAFDPMETAEQGDDLNVYISTSQIFHEEPRNTYGLGINGKIQTVRGANLDIVTNVITGLPVSELDHAINGIYFGDNGELYMAVGSNTNGGIPGAMSASQTMKENIFSAAILIANMGRPKFDGHIKYDAQIDGNPTAGYGADGVEVFGAGTRNPFGVFKHSNGHVYATENGPNPGFGNMATGCGEGQQIPDAYEFDELLLIKRGHYYGHPNFKRAENDPRQCVWRPASSFSEDGYTEPMMKLTSSTDGIIEFESDHFNGQLRGDLILSKYKGGLFRIILSEDGETVNPASSPALELAGTDGLAVAQAPDGSMVDVRYEQNACFSFQPDEPPSTKVEIKSIFPRRGGLAGGTKLMIFGANFSGSPVVTVGGKECANAVLVNAKKIECRLPTGVVGRADVVVTLGNVKDTFFKGYRYITGRPL